jgi:hypothetical protein
MAKDGEEASSIRGDPRGWDSMPVCAALKGGGGELALTRTHDMPRQGCHRPSISGYHEQELFCKVVLCSL